jgi:hypothetical protein
MVNVAQRLLLVGLLPLVLLASAGGPVAAQAGGDEGTFRVTINGRTAGTEEFNIRQSGAGASVEMIATGRVQITLPSGTVDLQPRLRASGIDAAPVAYQVEIGGDSPRRMVGTLSGGRFSARTATASGEQLREYVASSGAVVLDDFVAHHYYFLTRRLRSGRVPVILPRENRQVMATVTDHGEQTTDVDGTRVSLFRVSIEPAGMGVRHVWVDAMGRVIRVEVPDQGYVAVRTPMPR